MFYVDDGKENNYTWKDWIWFVLAVITIVFAILSFLYGPPVTPPQSMKSPDPYWYSGE